MGYMTPPREEPEAEMPIARARFLLKYEGRTEVAVMKSAPPPRPQQMPWARISCQYLSQRDIIIMPSATEKEPKRTSSRGEPMSKMGPQDMGDAHRKNEVNVPIHAIDEFVWPRIRVSL